MQAVFPSTLLRVALIVDAAASAAVALLQVALPGALAERLQLPQALLVGSGWFMVAYVLLVGWMARAPRLPVALVRFIVIGNLGWGLAALGLVLGRVVAPNTLGVVFMGLHVLPLFAFAAAQGLGLARSMPARTLTPSA